MDSQGITPRFEFGFGLSYTTFAYSSLSIAASGTTQVITFEVTNTGAFPGTEIPQVYLAYPISADEPKQVLRGFDEVPLDIGASSTVTIIISQREMRYLSVYNILCSQLIRLIAFGIPRARHGSGHLEHSQYT